MLITSRTLKKPNTEERAKLIDERNFRPSAVVLLDITGVEKLREEKDEQAVAGILRAAGNVLRAHIRGSDRIYRASENSFAVLLTDAGAPAAERAKDRLAARLCDKALKGSSLKLKASSAPCFDEDTGMLDWLKRANQTLRLWEASTSRAYPRRKVLVVDEEQRQCEVLSQYLTARGFDVTACFTGEDAVTQLAHGEFDILFLDLKLPDMTASDVIDRIHRNKSRMKVIVLTASHDEKFRHAAESRGVEDFIQKPVSLEHLHTRLVADAVERRA